MDGIESRSGTEKERMHEVEVHRKYLIEVQKEKGKEMLRIKYIDLWDPFKKLISP